MYQYLINDSGMNIVFLLQFTKHQFCLTEVFLFRCPLCLLFQAKCFVLAAFLNCKNARVIFIFQNGFENWILNVFGKWVVCIKFWNFKFLSNIRKEIIQILCCFRFKSGRFFSIRFIFFLNTVLLESKGFTIS